MNSSFAAAAHGLRRNSLSLLLLLFLAVAARAQITIQPIITRPCLLSGPEDVADIKARLAAHPMSTESLLNNYLSGSATQKQAANDKFFTYPGTGDGNGLLLTYVGEHGRRLVEDLMRYDIALGLGLATASQKQQMLTLATDFVHTTFGNTLADFPAVGLNKGNLWLENVIALGLTALNFPDQTDAQAWITQAVAYMDYEIDVEFLDGAARETPRYHDWELLHLSNFLVALQRRCGVDRYDTPALKQGIEWYARFAGPPLSAAGSQPIIPAWGDATYSETEGKQFYVPALFASAYKTRDPYFSQRLMYWWRKAGSPNYTQQAFGLTNPQILDPRLPDSPQAPRPSFYAPTLGEAILRVGSEDPDEMTATFLCGAPGISHEDADNGHIDLFAFGVPLALDSMSGPYDISNDNWNSKIFAHNTVRFQGQEPSGSEASNATFNAFGSSDIADYVAGNTKYGSTSVRRVVFVKPDYLVVWDQCDAANYSDFWLHTPAQTLEWQDHKVISHTPWNVDLDVDFLLPSGTLPQPTIPALNPTSDYTTRNTVASQASDPGGPALYTLQGEGRFGEWTNPNDNSLGRNPFTFKRQTFFSVRSPITNGHYLTVWHPRKVGVTPALVATLTGSTSTSVSLSIDFNGRTDTIAINTAGATITKGGVGSVQFADTYPQSGVSGAARYVKSGYGTANLSTVLPTNGAVEVTMGTLALVSANRIPDTAPLRLRYGGTFDLGASNETVGDLLLDGGALVGTGALSVANIECWGGTLSANVSGTGSFHKKGAGAWALSHLTYAGDTFIDAGILTLPGGSTLPGTNNLQLAAGAVLDLNTTLTLPASANLTWSGNVIGTGSIVNNGTLHLVGSGTLPAGMNFTNNGILDVTSWTGTLPNSFVNNGSVQGGPPWIVTPPQNQTIAAGRTVQFTVTPGGAGPLSYQWLFNGLPLTDAGNVSGATTSTLTFTGVVAADAANYSVVVSNAGGSATSSAASLTVDASAPTGTIVNDPFTDASRTNASAGDLLGIPYFTSGAASTLTIADESGGIGSGSALLVSPGSTALKVIGEFNPITLSRAGSFIQLQFDIRYTQTPDNAGAGFRFGLYQTFSTHTTADGATIARNDDKGYGGSTNPGAVVASSNRVFSEDSSDDVLGGTSPSNLVNFSASATSANLGTTKHTVKLVITRQANSDLVIAGYIDGTSVSGTHAAGSVLTYAFNELAIGNSSTAKAFAIDNLSVTTNNPPRIAVATPTTGIVSVSPATTLDLTGTASDDAAVTQVTWSNSRGGSGTATGTSSWSISGVPLAVGVNVITVTASNAAGHTGTATLTVTRTQPGSVQFTASSYTVNESAGAVLVSVTRTGGTDGAISASYATSNGSAVAELDYATESGILNWAAGDATPRSFQVPLLPGSASSGDLTLNVSLSSPGGGATIGTPGGAAITIHHAPTDHWRFVHFGVNANNAAVSGDLVNPAGDGIVNLLKYALALDPAENDSRSLPVASDDGTYLSFSYTRVIAENDITYLPQWSDDLQTWSSTGITQDIVSDDGTMQQIRAKVPASGGSPHRYLRLGVTRP